MIKESSNQNAFKILVFHVAEPQRRLEGLRGWTCNLNRKLFITKMYLQNNTFVSSYFQINITTFVILPQITSGTSLT
jgi:hypothetical protein